MDVTQALKDAENTLRDFIAFILRRALGDDWELESGVSSERVEQWKERKQIEEKRQESGTVDERLIYYSNFYDLKTILKKHWQAFSPALGDWKTMEVWLTEIEKLRDPDAHRRELLPHQQHLLLGISGEIRTRIVRFRSTQETEESYFPRIENIRDSLGGMWTINSVVDAINTKRYLRPGDTVDFVITAVDPFEAELEYSVVRWNNDYIWQKDHILSIRIGKQDIGNLQIAISIRSSRDYHAANQTDANIILMYVVLPNNNS